MIGRRTILFLAPALVRGQAIDLGKALDRVAEEAGLFAAMAPKVMAQEWLQHRGRKAPPRFRPNPGSVEKVNPALVYLKRELVSEFGFAAMKDAPEHIREFRKVVSVDGKQVRKVEKARLELAQNMTSEDDRERKRMLQDLEKYGMIGAATDFSQSILLFRKRDLPRYEFETGDSQWVSGDRATAIKWKQTGREGGAHVFHGKQLSRVPMSGEIWVRNRDLLPLRITLRIPVEEDKQQVLHTGEVDYYQSKYGLLLPTTVRYRKTIGDTMLVENVASIREYKMFAVQTDIKFTVSEIVDPAPPPDGPSR